MKLPDNFERRATGRSDSAGCPLMPRRRRRSRSAIRHRRRPSPKLRVSPSLTQSRSTSTKQSPNACRALSTRAAVVEESPRTRGGAESGSMNSMPSTGCNHALCRTRFPTLSSGACWLRLYRSSHNLQGGSRLELPTGPHRKRPLQESKRARRSNRCRSAQPPASTKLPLFVLRRAGFVLVRIVLERAPVPASRHTLAILGRTPPAIPRTLEAPLRAHEDHLPGRSRPQASGLLSVRRASSIARLSMTNARF